MNVINIGNLVSCQYLLRIPSGGYLAIDTGYAGGFARYCRQLEKKSIKLGEIKFLFLTHAHDDHAGFLAELLSASGATLIVDKRAPERLAAGHNQWIGGCSGRLAKTFVQAMTLFGKGGHEFPPYPVADDAILWDGETQPLEDRSIPMRILGLPGHTADSIGLLTEDGQLFCGDAAMNGFPSIRRNIIWIENMEAYKRSWDVMIASGAKTIVPVHGRPFPVRDLVRYRSSLESLKLVE